MTESKSSIYADQPQADRRAGDPQVDHAYADQPAVDHLNEANERARQTQFSRWVVKIGSALITRDGSGVDAVAIGEWAAQMATLVRAGKEVVVVTSGAIAEGCVRLGLATRPSSVHELQAAAAVGQMGLSRAWEQAFAAHGLHTGQVLLTHEDLASRQRYLNARSALRTLLGFGVVPVINENDTVATDEIRLGDNDTLGALVTNLIEADVLVLLTDQAGLHETDPRLDPGTPIVRVARANDAALDQMAGDSIGKLGRGGMSTKLRAARTAARSGASTIIASGLQPGVLLNLAAGAAIGTLLVADTRRLDARKQWIAGHLQTKGVLVIDEGAARVLRHQGRSLLPIGVLEVTGAFSRGDVVACVDPSGAEVARGLVNYSAEETRRIMRKPSDQIEATLGYLGEPELVHRDNLVLV